MSGNKIGDGGRRTLIRYVHHIDAGHGLKQFARKVSGAARAAGGEQTVLLSPACASFDQYPDFEVRGEAFRAAVRRTIDQGDA